MHTPRYAYGATARAQRCIFTLSGGGASVCAGESEKRCGGQKKKSKLMDGGRHMDLALKKLEKEPQKRLDRFSAIRRALPHERGEVPGEAEAPR